MVKLGFNIKVLHTKAICIYDHDYVISKAPMSFTTIFYKNDLFDKVKYSIDTKLLHQGGIPNKDYFMRQNIMDLIFINKLPKFLLKLKDKPISHYHTLTPIITGICKGLISRPPDYFDYDEFYNFIRMKKMESSKENEIK